jgi:hypothetical protein
MKDTNKDLEKNVEGFGTEENKDALSGEGRVGRNNKKKKKGEDRNLEIKEYMTRGIKKENR